MSLCKNSTVTEATIVAFLLLTAPIGLVSLITLLDSADCSETPAASPDPENVTVIQYLGAVQEVTDAEVVCTYGDYFRSGVKEAAPVSDGTRLVIMQSAHGLLVTTDLEKYASLYSERDLKNLAADVRYDLERHAAARADHAGRDSEETVETPVHPAENQ